VVNGAFIHQVYPLVGLGFAVIAPDLAGYANYGAAGNPPSAYADAADVGKSTLDAARALRKMLTGGVSDQVVLVGHSQGGQTALSALALAESYGAGGTIAAAAVYSPLWISARANGAFLNVPATYPIRTSSVPMVVAWYMYTHGELLDGPGHGVDVFKASARPAIKRFVDGDCWQDDYPELEAIGTTVNDLLDPDFIAAIAQPAEFGTCATDEPKASLCNKWMTRFRSDWPHLTGAAASVPILDVYGTADATITPDLATCVWNRLTADQANYATCLVPGGTHSGILGTTAAYVADWIAARTLGEAEPASACAKQVLLDDMGKPVACNPLLPKD
jgi:pimeloyl-ACP methyl ester carboxylesterase